jgi:hypothetical protein
VSPPKQWQLHGSVLSRHSSSLKNIIEQSTRNSECFRAWQFFLLEEIDGKIALVLQKAMPKSQGPAIKLEGLPDAFQSMAIPTPPSSEASSTSTPSPTPTREQPHAAIVEIYNQIFGSFYSVPVTIPTTTFSDTLTTCESLVKIASGLKCMPLIAPSVTSALLSHHRILFKNISQDPARYLLLALPLRSTALFTDSLTHIIGAHPSWPWPTPRSVLPPTILSLVVAKSAQLDRMCVETERELLLLTIEMAKSGPVQPQHYNHFDTWFVVQLFRDTLARAFHALETAKDRTLKRGTLYRQIAKGGDAYMALAEIKKLVARVMPSAIGGLEEDLGLLKGCAMGLVKNLVKNEAGVEAEAVGWLTCVRVGRGNVPWENEGRE